MKTIITITFVLFIGMTAQAHDAKIDNKVVTVEMNEITSASKEIKWEAKTDVVRLVTV